MLKFSFWLVKTKKFFFKYFSLFMNKDKKKLAKCENRRENMF